MAIFKGSEIVKLGIQIEKNGRDFYNTLVNQSKRPTAKDIFKYLAGEEGKHITVFEGLLNKVESYEPAESYPGEYVAYMTGMASEYVFTKKDKGAEIAKSITSEEEAVDKGIGFEKDSITFYKGMKKVVLEDDHKILDGLIAQEQNHLKQLSELKNNL